MTESRGNTSNCANAPRTASRQYDDATPEPEIDSRASYAPDTAPPHNIDAERAVLGAILLNPADTVGKVAETFAGSGAEAFYGESHRLIYAAIIALFEAQAPVDEISVPDQLRRTGDLERVGGIAYIAELTSAVPTSANAEHYAGIILEAHRRRVLGDSARRLAMIAADTGAGLDEVRTVMADLEFPDSAHAVIAPGADGLRQTLDRITSGQHRNIAWPGWHVVSRMGRALVPGSVSVICGTPGATKSFAMLQCLGAWNDAGTRACVYELEKSREYHLHRALAQRAGDSRILDDEWCREHPDDVYAALAFHEPWLRTLAPNIYANAHKHPNLDDLGGWVAARCREGYRIVVVDPVSLADGGRQPWTAAQRFMNRAQQTAGKFGASVVLVSHPKKGTKNFVEMDDIAGGAAFSREADFIGILEAHEPRMVNVITTDGLHERRSNRTMHLRKTRDGVGSGTCIAFEFDAGTLQLSECGVLQFDKKPQRGEGRAPRTTNATRAPRTPRPQQPALVPETDPFDDGEDTF